MTQIFNSLKGIVLTEEAEEPQKGLWLVFDEETAQVLNDPVRRRIIALFREGVEDTITTEEYNDERKEKIIRERKEQRHCLSVSDIVKMSARNSKEEKITRNQVYHHLPILIENGYLINYGTITTGKRLTTYYRRTAKNIIVVAENQIDADNDHITFQSIKMIDEYSSLFKTGFTEKKKEQLSKLLAKAYSLQLKMIRELSEQINQDVTSPNQIEILQDLIHIHSIGNPEYISTMKRMNDILFSKEAD